MDLDRRRVIFLETKNGESRGCSLNSKAFEALANLPSPDPKRNIREGAVFRTEEKQAYRERVGGGGQIKTAWRTACASALAARYLARDDASHLLMFGAGALKSRLTRSSGQGAALSLNVVRCGLPRMTPFNPMLFISLPTVQRAISKPSRLS